MRYDDWSWCSEVFDADRWSNFETALARTATRAQLKQTDPRDFAGGFASQHVSALPNDLPRTAAPSSTLKTIIIAWRTRAETLGGS